MTSPRWTTNRVTLEGPRQTVRHDSYTWGSYRIERCVIPEGYAGPTPWILLLDGEWLTHHGDHVGPRGVRSLKAIAEDHNREGA